MGHVVNPTGFRLGKVLFWKFNFIHFRQRFLFNKYFLLSSQCYKLISWLFQSPLTISYSFNRFLRFLMKKTMLKKFVVFNFFSSKFFLFSLYKISDHSRFYRLVFFSKSVIGLNNTVTIISRRDIKPLYLYRKSFLSIKSNHNYTFVSALFNLFKTRRLGSLNFSKLEYRALKRKNKKYIWIFKKSLIRLFVKLKFSKALTTSKYFNNSIVGVVLQAIFTNLRVRKFNLKLVLIYFFFKQQRLRKKFIFRNKFKNLMVNLELDNVIINLQNDLLQLNMIIFKEFWLDNFKISLLKVFYERSYLRSRQSSILSIFYAYFVTSLDFLKRTLICYFLDILNPFLVERRVWTFIFSLDSLRSFIIRNYENYFYFFNLKKRKNKLKFLYNLFFSKRVSSILTTLFNKFFSGIRSIHIKYFFLNNHLMNAKTVFRFIFKQLMLLRTINKIMYIVLLELRRTKLFAGFKILLRGRFTRRERAFSRVWMSGQIPTSTVSKKLDYYANHFISKFGVGSIRIWLYRAP